MTNEQPNSHFSVHPSVVYQLGESLVVDAVQALVELIKNAYDADATFAKITIDTTGDIPIEGAKYPGDGGRIIVEDDGTGMSREAIESGWLIISNRQKLTVKQSRLTTAKGRTPLGDKGLGRLSAQRLGENIDVFTKGSGQAGYHFAFSWLDFATAATLDRVSVVLTESELTPKRGTRIVISGLRDLDQWKGQASLKHLQEQLSQMISPYSGVEKFTIYAEIDGNPIDLHEMKQNVRDLASVRYSLRFDGSTYSIVGRAKLQFFQPSTENELQEFALLAESDHGSAFWQFMSEQGQTEHFKTRRAKDPWFVEFSRTRALDDLQAEMDPVHRDRPANPGPFSGEVDGFNLSTTAFRRQSVFDTQAEYRSAIKTLSGIRAYRDGFRIKVDDDWLSLGAQWTSARSYYGLKPDTTLGFIALSARDNGQLLETTDRAGFIDTPYFRNFRLLLEDFTQYASQMHNYLRRSWVGFTRNRREQLAHVDSRKTVESISESLSVGLESVATQRKPVEVLQRKVSAVFEASQPLLRSMATGRQPTSSQLEDLTEVAGNLSSILSEVGLALSEYSKALGNIGELGSLSRVLEDRVDRLRAQMDDLYETVALGLTAEALSHEIFQIADGLSKRTKAMENRLRRSGEFDQYAMSFVEVVHASVMSLRKQISFLSPSLRYVREQRQVLVVKSFTTDIAEFYRERLARSNISVQVVQKGDHTFVVRINKGKFSQILDNFLLNSEYWLKEDMEKSRIESGVIRIELESPFIRISDNGRGIDPIVETGLFEPFVSAKGRGKGRGLGLFVTKQLLDAEGCAVGVTPQRNRWKRLFCFQLDMTGAVYDG